jgi:hypothetical protein
MKAATIGVLIIIAAISSLYIPLNAVYAQFLFPNQNEDNNSIATSGGANNAEESNQHNATSDLLTYKDHLGFKLPYGQYRTANYSSVVNLVLEISAIILGSIPDYPILIPTQII